MKLIKPSGLRVGDVVGIISLAGPVSHNKLEKGKEYLRKRGFRVAVGKFVEARSGFFAGTDSERLEDFHKMFFSPEVRAVFISRGGYGCSRLLSGIDYTLIRRRPKVLVGFSDITAIQLALHRLSGLVTFYGPMVSSDMSGRLSDKFEEQFWSTISKGEKNSGQSLFQFSRVRIIKHGKASGRLLGGCISLINSLLGTIYFPDFRNSILFLEDINEEPYRIDRHLTQLRLAGVFKSIKGLVFGKFAHCKSIDRRFSNITVDDVITEQTAELDIPVISNVAFGHVPRKLTLPQGVKANIDTWNKEFRICEPSVL